MALEVRMERQQNVLSYVINNENETTQLFYALLAYKPVREVIVKLWVCAILDERGS
jgi:hypothetical protein